MSGHRHVGDGASGCDTGMARQGASVSRRRYVGTSTQPRLNASAPTCRYQEPKCQDTAASRYRYVGQDGHDRVPVDWEGTTRGRRGRDGRDRMPADRDATLARPTGTGWTGSRIAPATVTGPLRGRQGRGRLASNSVVLDKGCPAEDSPCPIRGGLQLGAASNKGGPSDPTMGCFQTRTPQGLASFNEK